MHFLFVLTSTIDLLANDNGIVGLSKSFNLEKLLN